MDTMQAFYDWLSAASATDNTYQRHLSLLARASRDQVLSVRSWYPWSIWFL